MIQIDNISEEVLDQLAEKYTDHDEFTVLDERKKLSFGEPREYFLIRKNLKTISGVEYCFIWIGCNLWQFSYVNTACKSEGTWKNPIELLNELLN